jgi:membrane protein DedA with SNARE-associated domain
LEGLIESLKPYLQQYGYWAVFLAILLEDFGIPAPGETVLIAGSLLASQGIMHILPLMLVAWSAAVIGDNIGYLIGHFGGRLLILRYGHYFFITKNRLEYVEHFFRQYGKIVVLVVRFFLLFRQLNGIVAGTADMGWSPFFRYNALGAALWVGTWGTLFYFLGQTVNDWGFIFWILLLPLLILAFLGLKLYRRRRPRR